MSSSEMKGDICSKSAAHSEGDTAQENSLYAKNRRSLMKELRSSKVDKWRIHVRVFVRKSTKGGANEESGIWACPEGE